MTSSRNRRENAWQQRKQNQKPSHGKVQSFEELSETAPDKKQ
ncbi:DUF6254 family protein [Paenibacillus sp. HB172176]|nr:DUF6254 family protein [Paenibacillus sp. HB172176]